jgi:hypothetical protein
MLKHLADRWAGSGSTLVDFYASQGLPPLFWGADVVRDGVRLPLRGTTPIENDAIVARVGTPAKRLVLTPRTNGPTVAAPISVNVHGPNEASSTAGLARLAEPHPCTFTV